MPVLSRLVCAFISSIFRHAKKLILTLPSQTIFKRIFEIRILHGYYLDYRRPDTSKKPGVYFEYGTKTKVSDLLLERAQLQAEVLEKSYDILQDVFITPTPETARLMRGLKMVTKTFPWGLVAGIEVEAKEEGGQTNYYPKPNLDKSKTWSFFIGVKNYQLLNITNHAFNAALPAYYYFTNLRAVEDGKVYPSFSVQLPGFTAERTWEMGELIRDGNDVKVANKETQAAADFLEFFKIDTDPKKNTWHQFAHSKDRVLLPMSFEYRFDQKYRADNPVLRAEFVLKDLDGKVLNSIAQSYSEVFPRRVTLDFRQLPIPPDASEEEKLNPKKLNDGWYDLLVQVNEDDAVNYRVYMRSDLTSAQPLLGMVELSLGETQESYRLLDANGALNRSDNQDGQPPHRLFEIRLLNRLSYWRYALKEPLSPKPKDKNYTYSERAFTTSKPRRLAQVRVPTAIKIGQENVALPNPSQPDLKYDNDNKFYYTELFLSTINPA